MEEIQSTDEQVGDAHEKKVIILQHGSGVPGNHENPERNENAEPFYEAVKQKIMVMAYDKESAENKNTQQDETVSRKGVPDNWRHTFEPFNGLYRARV
jgi:hypothetical protein